MLIRPRGNLYLHRSRTPGQARFIACMRPVAVVVMSKTVYDNLPADERESHWLASKVARKRRSWEGTDGTGVGGVPLSHRGLRALGRGRVYA